MALVSGDWPGGGVCGAEFIIESGGKPPHSKEEQGVSCRTEEISGSRLGLGTKLFFFG
jgi:hypothetical protein